MNGLGLVLTEVTAGSVFVTKFSEFPQNAPNPAQQEGLMSLARLSQLCTWFTWQVTCVSKVESGSETS